MDMIKACTSVVYTSVRVRSRVDAHGLLWVEPFALEQNRKAVPRKLGVGVEQLEEFDEFATAMTIPDQGMNLATDKIDTGQQADRAVAFIFKLPGEVGCRPGTGGRSGAVVAIAWMPGFSS